MNNFFDPFGLLPLWELQQRTAISATQTIVKRSNLMARGALTGVEATAMWVEKPAAFAAGFQDASMAAARGQTPSQIMQAALRPIERASGGNARRLNRR